MPDTKENFAGELLSESSSPAAAPFTPRIRPLSARQEAFAVDLASGIDPRLAYRKHYSWGGNEKNLSKEAHRQERNPRIAARVQTLRDDYARAAVSASRGEPEPDCARPYAVADAMAELDAAAAVAVAKDNAGALTKIVEVRMRLYGLGVGDAINPADRTGPEPEELEAALAQLKAIRKAREIH